MTVTIAKTAGFCFGVKRAVNLVYEEAGKGGRVFTVGPIIHNDLVVRDLMDKGVGILDEQLLCTDDGQPAGEGTTVIIRSHGVSRELLDRIRATGARIVDATCPFVKKIHVIVQNMSRDGIPVVIFGDPEHPEVKGIKGWAEGPCEVIENANQLDRLTFDKDRPLAVVAQTTFNFHKFQELVEIIKRLGYYVMVTNTICSATRERQMEAMELASVSDVMLVVGGRHSSNTQKLFDICCSQCRNTYFVRNADDLRGIRLGPQDKVGITAGASTPNTFIQEVSLHVRRAEL